MENSFFVKRIEADLRARLRAGGLCGAAEVLGCLSGLFHRHLENQLLSAAAALVCDDKGGPALLGARLFIGLCGDSAELPEEQVRGLPMI